ncbi:MAG: F0F1 ATP synthase subunit B [Opitutales bacterium]|nr:F0F1 ATP synthase subunit B [Opitutales bacterium]MBP3357277.1 F0F1 ATP synthase subunit B [Opitutales bacterium]MBQ2722911.1 F0F1 ATP synthase subunit B [Opitutales bacterium]MBR7105683.1 F0F1 ATP synthase subunit B [Opitutales bacterium]
MSAIFAAGGNPLNFLEQFGVEWQLLISQGVSFAIVATALYWFVFKPVIKASDKRKQEIEQGLQDAKDAKERLASAQAEADKKTAEAIAEASKILKSARDDAKQTIEDATREASAKATEIRQRNEEQLERDKLKMKEELKSELSGLVAEATEAVIGKVLTDQQRSELASIASKELKK